MLQYVEHSLISGEPLIDSDRESNKSEDGSESVQKEQAMFVWNSKYEVCNHNSLVLFNATVCSSDECHLAWDRFVGVGLLNIEKRSCR